MMMDLGGGARERFQNMNVEEPEEALPPLSSVGYTHPGLRAASWRSTPQGQDVPGRLSLLESVPHNLIPIKSDPENLSSLCISSSNASSLMAVSGPSLSSTEAAEDARAKGLLLQEITHVAETFDPYNSSLPPGCYRSYNVASDSQPHMECAIFADIPQWCWNRSPSEDKGLSGHNGGSLFTNTGPPHETVINSLQYNVPSHLMTDAFSSPLPPVSGTQSPASVPACSPIQKPPPPPPPPPSTLSSALDLSPGPPTLAHPLPSLQPSLLTPASAHMTLTSTTPSAHQLPTLQPSLIALDVPPQTLSSHDRLDDTLDLVGVEAPPGQERLPEFECGECGALFTRLPHLKHHMKIHVEELEKSCNKQGDLTTDSQTSKFKAQPPEKVFPCKQCGEKFSRAEQLKTHELKHSGDRPFRCGECDTAFPAKAMLIRHKKVHTGEKPYKCDICKTCFTEAGSLKVHKRLHSGEKPFKCDQCDVAFNGAGMLATHKRKHTGEKPYMCDECGEKFRLLSTLKSHRRRHTGEKPFVCELCGSSFTQRAAMQRHKRIHSDQKPWECEQCGYKFREKENLRKHIALHKIKLQHICDICGAGFSQAKKLETHKMLHNGGDRPYQCNKCPSTFTNPKYLTQHKKRVHDRKGAIKCEECNGTFKRKETLRSHMRIHIGERPYVCEECGAAFNQRGTLTKHIRVHGNQVLIDNLSKAKSFNKVIVDKGDQTPDRKGGEKTVFKCSVCDLNTPSQKELMRHIRSSHPSHKTSQENSASDQDIDDSSEHIRDKYICEDCDQTFFRRRQLKAHKKYCPCRCPSYPTEAPEKVDTAAAVQSDTREVDAMKLLTAVLAVTGNNTDEVSDFHHSPSANGHPASVSSVALHSSSSSSITTTSTIEGHQDHHESLRLFSPRDSSYTGHLSLHLKDNHTDQSPQHLPHLPHSPQPQHTLLHHTSQAQHHLDHSHLSLEHLSQDHLQHAPHIQTSDHQPSHILLPPSSMPLDSPQQPGHLEQPPPPPEAETHMHHQTQDQSEQTPRSHSSLQQEVSQQEHLLLISRQYSHLQHSQKEHSHIALPSRHQDTPHQPSRLQILSLKEIQLPQTPHETDSVHLFQPKEHSQIQHHHQIGLIVQGQIFKNPPPPPSLSGPHLPHHHLMPVEESDHNVHLHEHASHILPDIKDCDELTHELHHQDQDQTENCHCHQNPPHSHCHQNPPHSHCHQNPPHSHCHQNPPHSHPLPEHFTQHENQSDSDPRLHQHHHHHHHQQHPFCPTLECPADIKIESIIS